MKKLYILGFASLLSTAIIAQHTTELGRSKGTAHKAAKVRVAGTTRTVTGGIVCNTTYIAGTTMNLNFTITTTNQDGEYIDSLALTFPTGFTVNSSTTNPFPTDDATGGAEALNGVSGQTISWGSNVGNTDNYGGILAETPQSFDINVTIGTTVTGMQTLTFFAKGDEYPGTSGDPNGDLAGTIMVMEASPADIQALGAYIPSGCSLGNEQVLFVLKNSGTLPATGFNISYIVNGGSPVVETYTGTVNSGDTVLYTFTTLLNMATAGVYSLQARATITADGYPNNDTVSYIAQSISSSSSNPYTTGFESTPATDLLGWSSLDADNSGSTFVFSPMESHTGTQSLWAYENDNDGTSNDWAFSTCIDFTSTTSYRITYWKSLTSGYEGSLGISLGNMATIAGMTQTISPLTALTANGTWVKDSADFTANPLGTYYVGFNAVNTNTAKSIYILIDDINIYPVEITAINKASANINLSIYPSPSTGIFNINVNIANTQLEVYDLVGKKIYADAQIAKGIHAINLTNFAEGAYFARVISGSNVSTQKIIISK